MLMWILVRVTFKNQPNHTILLFLVVVCTVPPLFRSHKTHQKLQYLYGLFPQQTSLSMCARERVWKLDDTTDRNYLRERRKVTTSREGLDQSNRQKLLVKQSNNTKYWTNECWWDENAGYALRRIRRWTNAEKVVIWIMWAQVGAVSE